MTKFFNDKNNAGEKTDTANPAPRPAPKPKTKVPSTYHDLKPKPKSDNTCDDIDETLCEMLEYCWLNPYPKEEIVQAIELAERLKNAFMLKPLEINEQVKGVMDKSDYTNEKDWRYIGNVICAAGKHLAHLMDMLATAEITCHAEVPQDGGKLVMSNLKFDFPAANVLMKDSMKLFGMAKIQTCQHRRNMLLNKFKLSHQKLCDKNAPFTGGKFFGNNFDAATALITGENKVINEALKQNKQSYSKPQNNNFCGKAKGFNWTRSHQSPYMKELKQQNQYLREIVAQSPQPFLGMSNNFQVPPPQWQQQPPPPPPLSMFHSNPP